MATVALTRVPLDKLKAVDSRALLLTKAAALVAQNVLPTSFPLREALEKLGIDPLNADEVKVYKNSLRKAEKGWTNGTKIAFVGLMCMPLLMLSALMLGHRAAENSPQEVAGFIGLVASVIGTLVYACNFNSHARTMHLRVDWKRHLLTPLKGYSAEFNLNAMPDFALERFIQVREACPTAQFHVDALHSEVTFERTKSEREDSRREEEVRRRREADPFLVVTLGNEEFFLDVWDEPQFERTV